MTAINFTTWNKATGNLDWGVQRVMRDTIALVAEEKISLVYGADYREGKPCLVNAVAQMITASSGTHDTHPMAWFPEVVSAFDSINAKLKEAGVNTDGFVSPLAAEALLANFGTLKDAPTEEDFLAAASESLKKYEAVYVEPSDEEMAQAFGEMLSTEAPVEGVAFEKRNLDAHAEF